MAILIGLLVFALLLYFWLIGRWFARVLMTLVLVPLLYVAGGWPIVAIAGPAAAPVGVTIGIMAACSCWFIAGLPHYYWRSRMRALRAEWERHQVTAHWSG